MRNTFKTVATLAMVMAGSAGILGACQSGPGAKEETMMCQMRKPGTIVSVNEYCAVNNDDPVDPAIVTEWKGQTVGFCCKGCLPKWAKMTDAEKDAAVAKAVAKGKIKD